VKLRVRVLYVYRKKKNKSFYNVTYLSRTAVVGSVQKVRVAKTTTAGRRIGTNKKKKHFNDASALMT